MTKIMVVRHGTTIWVEQGKLHGILDSPLSKLGLQEAHLVAERLSDMKFDAFFVSPAGRVLETARIITERTGLFPKVLPDLHELDFGCLEGKNLVKALHSNGTLIQNLRRMIIMAIAYTTGEKHSHLYQRIRNLLDQVLAEYDGKSVLLITHASLHRVIFDILLGTNLPFWSGDFPIQPCGVSEIVLDSNRRIEFFKMNQTEHLITLQKPSDEQKNERYRGEISL
jgi:broad specificity phosphatase PhoE